ncbi:MAG: serine/threonine protein kinase [Phycisphaerales bacterium]|nr:serine/threonine protein kinase [Phycisphaerales bacterium]
MTPDPGLVAELLEQALGLPEAERESFLACACAGEASLRHEVETLRVAHDAARAFLGSPAAGVVAESNMPTGSIGPYTLVRRIGEGGFGVVYLARQEHPVRREVAIKIIKLGMSTEQVIRRFETERLALALMDHPNIARVLDAGATESGRPYFVMELVRGEMMTAHCDRERLDIRSRLELVRQVCLAVQHAHQKGVIHRDLKPGNVLISVIDGIPVPKVIDFGIAKATNSELTERTMFTEFRQLVGTPEYMSPEQAERSGVDIDTRSDIYSLGVLLYELLTGATPIDPARLRTASWGELQRMICEEEPPRPSTRVHASGSRAGASPPVGEAGRKGGAAERRGTDPPSLSRLLRRDLDWIVLKALAKDRARRYQSAGELAADLERHLRNLPVLATPPSLRYRLGKLSRRHRAVVASAAAIGVTLLVAVAALAIAVLRVSEARVRAVDAGRDASSSRDESDAVTAFLSEMLAAADPRIAERDVTVRELLDAASGRVDEGMSDRPRVAARLHQAIGSAYGSLGLFDQAEHHLRIARDTFELEVGSRSAEALMAGARLGTMLERQGRLDEALAELSPTVEAMRASLGLRTPETLSGISRLAHLLSERGQYGPARAMYEEALALGRDVLGATHPETLGTLASLAATYQKLGLYDEAETMYVEALHGLRDVKGEESPDTLATMGDLADLYLTQHRWKEASPLCERVLELRRKVLGPEHPETLIALNSLGTERQEEGRLEEAERLSAEALDAERRVLGPTHPTTVQTMNDYGTVLGALRRYPEAESLYREALEQQRISLGENHPSTLTTMNNLGTALAAQGKFQEAGTLMERVLDARRRLLGEDDFGTLVSMNTLAQLYIRMERYSDAERLLMDAGTKARRVLGERHGLTGVILLGRGWCLRELGRYPESEAVLLDARLVVEAAYPPGHSVVRSAADQLAKLYRVWGRNDDAERWDAAAKSPAGGEGNR